MVLVGAEGVVENGGIINKLGTCTLAMAARALGTPLYVAAESYKARALPLPAVGGMLQGTRLAQNLRSAQGLGTPLIVAPDSDSCTAERLICMWATSGSVPTKGAFFTSAAWPGHHLKLKQAALGTAAIGVQRCVAAVAAPHPGTASLPAALERLQPHLDWHHFGIVTRPAASSMARL